MELCRNLHLLQDEVDRRDQVTVTTGATAYLGGYSLKGAPAADSLRLSDEFLAQVKGIAAVSGNAQEENRRMFQMVTNFGSHYINRVWYGGLGERPAYSSMQSPMHIYGLLTPLSMCCSPVNIISTMRSATAATSVVCHSNGSCRTGVP